MARKWADAVSPESPKLKNVAVKSTYGARPRLHRLNALFPPVDSGPIQPLVACDVTTDCAEAVQTAPQSLYPSGHGFQKRAVVLIPMRVN